MKKFLSRVLPWLVTFVALYYAFDQVNFRDLLKIVGQANHLLLLVAFILTALSYLLRSYRWLFLLPKGSLNYLDSLRVLILGFFMNNILPARAGELVRAHLGSKVSHHRRTTILASILSERLIDGIVISLFFVLSTMHSREDDISHKVRYVAYLFGAVGIAVILILLLRNSVNNVLKRLEAFSTNKLLHSLTSRIHVFIEGLTPLSKFNAFCYTAILSILVWLCELLVYYVICQAFAVNLNISQYVLFMVVVNFSSLVPSAPGAFGTIEFFATRALESFGLPRELALAMVLCQHFIQYLVVGIPGAIFMITWKSRIGKFSQMADEES